jgi:RNA polymerase sigma-70 factor (ECF subfamily)
LKSDAQLIRDARNDPEAFGELYRRHAPAIHSWLRARAPARIAVELTAETFAQAALGLRRFRDQAEGSAGPWLHGIARNLLRRYLERDRIETRARERLGVEIRTDDEFERAEERAFAEHLRPELAVAVAALPPGQRAAVQLRVVDELPYRVIARRLGCTELAARLRVLRALNTLAQAVTGGEGR